jgi:proton-translocating NADH-quinone oxidoreductase chain N
VILPLVFLSGGAFAIYLVARLSMRSLDRQANALLALLTALALAAALGALVPVGMMVRSAMVHKTALPEWGHFGPGGAFLRAEPGALVVAGVALGLGAVVTVYSGRYLALDQRYETYYPLLLMLVTGLLGMVLAADLFNLYLFCELMSLAAYALVAFRRHTDTAIEAGFKYLMMGSVGTVVMLMGISFLYRAQGHLALPATLPSPLPPAGAQGSELWGRVGLACVMVGLAVKSAIVPMHTWLPDAHGRAPSSVSAMLSGIVIQSAFYVLLKVSLGLGLPAAGLGTLLILLAVLNMTLGNGMALVQTNTKRLLAYSTIAQMGYVMLSIGIGLRYGTPAAIQAGFFLLLAHAVMKGLAFLCKGVCHFYNGSTTVEQLRGTSAQLPLVAVSFGLALAGLAGVPLLAGFAGKWLLLTQALGAASSARGPAWLVYAALATFLLNSVFALGYFLPLIGTLFAPPAQGTEERGERTRISAWMAIPLVFLGGLVLAIGIYPGPWLNWMANVGAYLLPGL